VLAGYDAPFSIRQLEGAVHLEVASAELGAWLKSPAFVPLLHLVQGSAARRLTSEALLHEDGAVQMRWGGRWLARHKHGAWPAAARRTHARTHAHIHPSRRPPNARAAACRCESAYAAVQQHEEAHLHLLLAPALPPAALLQRAQLVALGIKYGTAFGLKLDTVYDGLELLHRVLAITGAQLNPSLWPLVLVACLLIAGRQGERPGGAPCSAPAACPNPCCLRRSPPLAVPCVQACRAAGWLGAAACQRFRPVWACLAWRRAPRLPRAQASTPATCRPTTTWRSSPATARSTSTRWSAACTPGRAATPRPSRRSGGRRGQGQGQGRRRLPRCATPPLCQPFAC
jgi:hypothetical protein